MAALADIPVTAFINRRGQVRGASPGFLALGLEKSIDADLVARLGANDRPGATLLEAELDSATTESIAVAYAPPHQSLAWPLSDEVRAAARTSSNGVVLLTVQLKQSNDALEVVCRSYGLSALQTRVAIETVQTGSVRAASERLGVSYHTARGEMAEAMRRVGARRLAAMVKTLASAGLGVPLAETGAEILTQLWALTPRQAQIAALIAEGMSRAETATALRLSESVVKKELQQIFQALQVNAAASLARRVLEAAALSWMSRTADVEDTALSSNIAR